MRIDSEIEFSMSTPGMPAGAMPEGANTKAPELPVKGPARGLVKSVSYAPGSATPQGPTELASYMLGKQGFGALGTSQAGLHPQNVLVEALAVVVDELLAAISRVLRHDQADRSIAAATA